MPAMRITLSEQRRRRLIFLLENKANRRREVLSLPGEPSKREWINVAIGTLCLVAAFIILNIAN